MWVDKEMKMSDVFELPVSDCLIGKLDHGQCVKFVSDGVAEFEAIASAVNNHDRLIEENRRLTELAAQKASRADELFEALQGLRDALSEANMYVGFDFANEIGKADDLIDKIKQESNDE